MIHEDGTACGPTRLNSEGKESETPDEPKEISPELQAVYDKHPVLKKMGIVLPEKTKRVAEPEEPAEEENFCCLSTRLNVQSELFDAQMEIDEQKRDLEEREAALLARKRWQRLFDGLGYGFGIALMATLPLLVATLLLGKMLSAPPEIIEVPTPPFVLNEVDGAVRSYIAENWKGWELKGYVEDDTWSGNYSGSASVYLQKDGNTMRLNLSLIQLRDGGTLQWEAIPAEPVVLHLPDPPEPPDSRP